MNKEIEKIIFNLEGCCGMFDYILTPIENNLLVSYIKELQQENQQLKEELDEARDNVDYYSNVYWEKCEVLDEIREYINNTEYYTSAIKYLKDSTIGEDLLQILDKVKENESKRNV